MIGLAGCLYAPTASIWPWAVILGIGQGRDLRHALTLIVDALRRRRRRRRGCPAWRRGSATPIAAGGPLLMGLLSRTWTGDWFAAGPLLFAIAFACLRLRLLAARDAAAQGPSRFRIGQRRAEA